MQSKLQELHKQKIRQDLPVVHDMSKLKKGNAFLFSARIDSSRLSIEGPGERDRLGNGLTVIVPLAIGIEKVCF
jgi:hypothetical protein